jgi:hypothetical protein
VSDKPPKPARGPRPPDDSAPLNLEHTPATFLVTVPYVKAKLLEAEKRLAVVADQAAREAAREENNGKPVLPKALTPWFLAAFTLCGSVTTVAMTFEGAIPRPLLITAAVGSMFFGAMLGVGPGLRK